MEGGSKPDPGLPRDQAQFIADLNLLRAWAGSPSYAELARLSGIPRSTLADVLGNKRKWLPSLDLVVQVVKALGCTPSEAERWSTAWRWLATRHARRLAGSADAATPAEPACKAEDETWVIKLTPKGESHILPVRRRDVFTIGAASVVGFSVQAHDMSAAARNPATLAAFRSDFDAIRRAGQTISPSIVFPRAVVQASMLRSLASGTAGSGRNQFLLLGARFAEYAGWMAQESGADQAALWWTDKAVEMADSAGNSDLAAYALVRRGLIKLYQHDAKSTIDLARHAQADTRVPPRIRGLAAQREAQGHALAGDYNRCRRALDRAAVLLEAALQDTSSDDGPGVPILGPSNTLDQAAVATGWCMHDLGRAREATDIMAAEIARIPISAHRARARYGTRLALAYTAAGDIDHACAVADHFLPDVEAVDSATIRTDLRLLVRTLAPCQTYRPVRELYPRFTAALHASAGDTAS